MRNRAFVGLGTVVVFGLALLIYVQAIDVSGDWRLAIKSNFEIPELTCTFKQADGRLTGSCKGSDGPVIDLAAGDVDGNKVTWQFNIPCTTDGQSCTYEFTGALNQPATAIDGSFTIANSNVGTVDGGTFIGQRQ